jgi:uncharacterized protein YcbK (DUF882 family)
MIRLFTFLILTSCWLHGVADAADARSLSFYHTHSKQALEVTYYRDGHYDADAMKTLRVFLADWRDHVEMDIDPELMDILWEILQLTGHDGVYEVISAYRSPQTNTFLRTKSSGVAKNSMHLIGQAIDIRLRGFETKRLRDVALEMGRGGVGYYEDSDFVHVDTGRARRW